MIKETPILYTPEMIRAKLEGRKSMTRRIMLHQPPDNWMPKLDVINGVVEADFGADKARWNYCKCPYGKVGDMLWVQEGYIIKKSVNRYRAIHGEYIADGKSFNVELTEREWELFKARKYPYRKTPGRFMYKSLSRFKDTIIDIRAEKVQDISAIDCMYEGIEVYIFDDAGPYRVTPGEVPDLYIKEFSKLWDRIHGIGAWKFNDMVWVLEY